MEIKVTRLFDVLTRMEERFSFKEVMLGGKENGEWKTYSAAQYKEIVDNISYGFIKLGVKPGDKIATILNNRPEWNFLDMAIQRVGAIHVPIYPTISQEDYKYILNHAEVTYVFLFGKELYYKIEGVEDQIPGLKDIYTIKKIEEFSHLGELIEDGKNNPDPEELKSRMDAIKTDDLATLIYTSGTTGKPKGVMLSHANIISNMIGVSHIPPCREEGVALSYLPLCHIYERMLNYLFQYIGITVYYAESVATIADNMKDIKPNIMSTVPRLLEKIYDKIMSRGRALKGIKRLFFAWAIKIGLKYELHGQNSIFFKIQHKIVDKLVFSKWREATGGNIQVMVSGGAALQPRLGRSFNAAGIPVIEGYGLTETSPVIAANYLQDKGNMIGTVGPVLRGVEVKIAEDHEVLCKGPNVMMGYYKDPEMTKEVIDEEGWFHTGDMGKIVEGRFLKLTGRKKELFKTSFGKYIAPGVIEDKLKESSFIDNCMVVGESQKFAGALIVPEFSHLRSWCKIKEIKYTNDAEMVKDPVIKKRIMREVNKMNESLGATEQVKKIEIMDHEWSLKDGELTPKMNIKRAVLCDKYKDLIEQMFN